MAADVDIVNIALVALGAARITSLTDGSANANAANDVYTAVRDQVLRAHDWKFAKTRVQLTEVATAPAFAYDHQFALPSDWIRTVEVSDNDNGLGGAIVEEETYNGQRVLLTNSTALYLVYIYRATDPNLYTPDFIIAFAVELAKRLAIKIPSSSGIKADLEAEVAKLVLGAKSVDAMGQTPRSRPAGSWLTTRYGWRGSWFRDR